MQRGLHRRASLYVQTEEAFALVSSSYGICKHTVAKAAKLLNSGAARAMRFLWHYPTAQLIVLFYLIFVHLFLMYLLHRLQERADNLTAR